MFIVYMPKVVSVEEAKTMASKPWFINPNVPVGAVFMGVLPVPTIADIVGFSASSGPPGFGFWCPAGMQDVMPRLFSAITPHADCRPFFFSPLQMFAWRGALSLAVEFNRDHFMEHFGGSDLLSTLQDTGWTQFETHVYEVPAILRQV